MNKAHSPYHLAQINVGQLIAPQDDPRVAEFIENIDRINAQAENSPGFVWRLKDDTGTALSFQAFENPLIISNLSVWQDVESLRHFVYNTQHREFLSRRKEWFELMKQTYLALWWIPAGYTPTLEEGIGKLAQIKEIGPTPSAFNFTTTFSIAACI